MSTQIFKKFNLANVWLDFDDRLVGAISSGLFHHKPCNSQYKIWNRVSPSFPCTSWFDQFWHPQTQRCDELSVQYRIHDRTPFLSTKFSEGADILRNKFEYLVYQILSFPVLFRWLIPTNQSWEKPLQNLLFYLRKSS